MRRAPVPLLLVLTCACGGSGDSSVHPAAPAARVILVTCDTLRADHLGTYGCRRGLTPNLDDLAAQSLVFEEGTSCAPLTGPALSSLLTGKLPDQIGVAPGNRSLMPPEVFTLAEAIAAEPVPWHDEALELGVSYGIYTFAGGEAVDEALNAADHAMYASKRNTNDATR